MKLIKSVEKAIHEEYKSPDDVGLYVKKWHETNYDPNGFNNDFWENFEIVKMDNNEINLTLTLHSMKGTDLLKVAIDLGVDTPDFIPSIPTFKNELKSDYKTAYNIFTSAYKQIDTDPGVAVGLANSALESIIKEILKDERMSSKISGNNTLYKLTSAILKEFKLTTNEMPKEIKLIVSNLTSICQSIEKIRSDSTFFHGKTDDDYLITESIYANLIVNSVTTVGLFLNSYFRTKFPPSLPSIEEPDLPF